MLIVVIFEFFLCWCPVYILQTWQTVDYLSALSWVTPREKTIFSLTSFSSACFHPLTYCFMNKNFREGFKKVFRRSAASQRKFKGSEYVTKSNSDRCKSIAGGSTNQSTCSRRSRATNLSVLSETQCVARVDSLKDANHVQINQGPSPPQHQQLFLSPSKKNNQICANHKFSRQNNNSANVMGEIEATFSAENLLGKPKTASRLASRSVRLDGNEYCFPTLAFPVSVSRKFSR